MKAPHALRPGLRFVSLSAVVLAVGLVLAAGPATLASSRQSTGASKIDSRVLRQAQSTGRATYWAVLAQHADLSAAPRMKDSTGRGWFVVNALKSVATTSQRGLAGLLSARGASFTSFWIVNTVRVVSDAATLRAVASRSEVASIVPDIPARIPNERVSRANRVQAVEWNIKNIRAPKVWNKFNVRGEGMVVANIDTGVQYNHPALVKAYRGNLGGGSFNHNYNWFDPSHICGNPSTAPCDNVGHGSHTMGTMVGKDGVNKIGVAPKAKWIAAKGCESNSCSTSALLSSGQWILAPTNLNNQSPRADLRPDVVNNSWGTPNGSDTFYQSTVTAWVSSGIFPQFSAGNSGPGCGTVGAPGSYSNSYAAGAYDINNNIASFSSRGPSPLGGGVKPNVSAPGVNVRSSVPNNTYALFSGTSMASPHVAGTVALIWSKKPSLERNITMTRSIIDSTAVDTSNLTCGGTAGNNNVYGQGRLDAYAAVAAALRSEQSVKVARSA